MLARHSHSPRFCGAVAVIAILLALSFPAISRADCGGTQTAHAVTHPTGQAPPLALGDSTMLLSLPGLAAAGYDADAHGCRQFYQALDMLRQLKRHNVLPHLVAIALGANGSVTQTDISQALNVLCCHRLLVLMTPRESGGGSGSDAATERVEAKRHPGRILLLDWVKYSQGHGSWFQPDGLHLTFPGVSAFTALLVRALPYAYAPCPPAARVDQRHAGRGPRTGPAERLHAARRRSAQAADPAALLSLHTALGQIGYVDATISGPPGAQVQLSEQSAQPSTPLSVITLPASGTATVPRVMTWLCAERLRSLLATTLPPAAAATAISTVATPSCSHRVQIEIAPRTRVGRDIIVRLSDRWGLGGVPLKICLAPPGARAGCTSGQQHPGQPKRSVHLPAARPGGWRVTVETPYERPSRKTVWVTHPGDRIRLLAAGDSEMQLLDDFMAQDLRSHGVSVTSDARISTGLTNSFFFNWQTAAHQQAETLRPDVTVMFMGANDGFGVSGPGGQQISCCGPAWSSGYATLVAEMMTTLLRGNAGRVYWFLLPTPRAGNFRSLFNAVNRGIHEAAARFPGRVGLIDANAFFTPHNQYRDYMVYRGHGFVIHESDGVHLSTSSDQVAATLVMRQLVKDRVIH